MGVYLEAAIKATKTTIKKQIVYLIHQGYGRQLKQIAYLTDACSCQYSCSVAALFTSVEITLFDVVPF